MVAIANGIALQYSGDFRAIQIWSFLEPIWGTIPAEHQHEAWRYTLISGLIPAIPLLVIRPFLPESPTWARKRQAGTLRRPSIAQLFSPELRRTTIVTALMVACSYGAAFGAIQQLPQIVPGLADVRQKVAAAQEKQGVAADSPEGKKIKGMMDQKAAAEYTKMQEIGGLVGRFLLAALAVVIVSRRALLRVFQWPGLILMPLIFAFFLQVENRRFAEINLDAIYLGHLPITTMSIGAFLAGLVTVAQFSFWGNYLPRVYPLHLRGTGESFAANIGGRMIGTSAALVTTNLAPLLVKAGWVPALPGRSMAVAAASVVLFVYLAGSILSFWLPEPTDEGLPE